LNAAVAVAVHETERRAQHEVVVALVGGEEFILFEAGRLGDDHAVVDPPDVFASVPT